MSTPTLKEVQAEATVEQCNLILREAMFQAFLSGTMVGQNNAEIEAKRLASVQNQALVRMFDTLTAFLTGKPKSE